MGIFALRARRPTDGPEARADRPELLQQGVPQQLEAVGEALASGAGAGAACAVAGGELARAGVSLEEALDALGTTYAVVLGSEPGHDDTRALAVAWADATLAWLHQLSCDDPLTGLASLAHVRGRLADLYRGEGHRGAPARESHALVLLEVPGEDAGDGAGEHVADGLARALQVGRVGATARSVFSGGETIGRAGSRRVVVVAGREELGRRAALLRRMVAEAGTPVRLWIEGLPGTDAAAAQLLDELARC